MSEQDPRPTWVRLAHRFAEGLYRRVFWLIAMLGLPPGFIVRLEVEGCRSGKVRSVIVLCADHDGSRYLVSVLGERANWVRNVRAAGGAAVIRHGRTHRVRLEEVPAPERPPILRAYLKRALGARPLFAVAHDASLQEFARIAPKHLVFRVATARGEHA